MTRKKGKHYNSFRHSETKNKQYKNRKTSKTETNMIQKFEVRNFKHLVLRIPVKFGLFGKLKKDSFKLVHNILLKNNLYFNVFDVWETLDKKTVKRQKEIINTFINKKKLRKSNENIIDDHELFSVVKKHNNYYVYIHLETAFKEICMRSIYEKRKINYIELRTHFYENQDKQKQVNFVDFYNIETNVTIKTIDNVMYYSINGDVKKSSCIYRIGWDEKEEEIVSPFWYMKKEDVNKRKMKKYNTNNIWRYDKYSTKCYIFLIPNSIRYKYKFNKI